MELVQERPELLTDHSIKTYVRFVPKTVDALPRVGDGWTPSKRLLLFELKNGQGVSLALVLGPGEPAQRQRLHRAISQHPKVFNRASQTVSPKWWTCHSEKWVGQKQYDELDVEDLRQELRKRLDGFVAEHLPAMEAVLKDLGADEAGD